MKDPEMTNQEELMTLARQVLDELGEYIAQSERGVGSVLVQRPAGELADFLRLGEWVRNGGLSTDDLPSFISGYLDNTQHMHHPGYMGHQVAVPHRASGIADMIHGFINNPMAIYEMGPAAATI